MQMCFTFYIVKAICIVKAIFTYNSTDIISYTITVLSTYIILDIISYIITTISTKNIID